jgi:hypothetical protein
VKYIDEKPRSIPVMAETDVLVLGSGPGGLAAALSASRAGMQTMLVERYGCFGGVITQVGVPGMTWYHSPATVDVEGIGIEFANRAREFCASHPANPSGTVNVDIIKVLADQMLQEAGIEALLHCLAVAPIMNGETIQGVITESKSGRQAILARRVIDATGDADIAYRAGAPCNKSPKNEKDLKKVMMGVTTRFSCKGVDKPRFLDYVKAHPKTIKDWSGSWAVETSGKEDDLPATFLDEPFKQARSDGLIPESVQSIEGSWGGLTDTGDISFNIIYMFGYDCSDTQDLTRAEIDGRQAVMFAIQALRKYTPGFENAGLREFAMTLGTRDSRKIIGRYNLTKEDVLNQARFADTIGIFPEFIDGYGVLILPTTGRYFQVPYGILVPQKVDNLLVAGRCVAGDAFSHGATREQMCCMVTGQGAGVAAAVSIKDNVTSRQVEISHVQKALQEQGVRIN